MIKVYLKAKTFDELILKMKVANTLAGREYQYNESFYAKGYFYVTYKDSFERWNRVSSEIEKRFKPKSKKVEKSEAK